jgi:hypothetical protein
MADKQNTGAVPGTKKEKPPRVLHYVVAWLVAVLAFGLGTLKSDAIKQAFPFCCLAGYNYPSSSSDWTWSCSAILFWAAAFLWMILYGLRLRAESKQAALLREQSTKVAQSVKTIEGGTDNLQQATANVLAEVGKTLASATDLRTKIGQVNDAVQTLPPRAFRAEFARNSTMSYTLLATTFPRHTDFSREDQQVTIRLALAQLVNLRRTYEEKDQARYAANVMIYKAGIPKADVMQKVLRIAPEGADASQLEGALVLLKELSTSTDAPEDEDRQLPDVAFGVPVDKEDKKSPWLLPGATDVYVQASKAECSYLISGYHDTYEIGYLAKTFAISAAMMTRLTDYFQKEGKMIRSFISVPMNDRGGRVFGVLNIHSDAPYRSGDDKERQANFGLIIAPLVNEIAEACLCWMGK